MLRPFGLRPSAGGAVLLLCLALAGCHRAPAPPAPRLSLTILAGRPGGVGDADGSGAAARFCFPGGLAADGRGHVYVADSGNDLLRRVDLATGETETVAGVAGVSGAADGRAAAARLSSPHGLAWDGKGHLFVADSGNAAIRLFEVATGRLSTLVRRGSGLALPEGLALEGSRLYVADSAASVVWAVDPRSGALVPLAGKAGSPGEIDGSQELARLRGPAALAADAAGRLYVAEAAGRAIRAIDLATGSVSTVAPAAHFAQPQALALDGEGHLYVADAFDETLRRIDLASGAVALVAGRSGVAGDRDGDGALFAGPAALAFLGPSRLGLADATSIRSVALPSDKVAEAAGSEQPIVRTLAGRGSGAGRADGRGGLAALRAPRGVALDGHGQLYVADTGNALVRRVDPRTGEVSGVAGVPGRMGTADGPFAQALFERPVALAVGDGEIYVADGWSHTVRRLDLSSGRVSTLAGAAGKGGWADGVGPAARFCGPLGLALDGAGHLFVADSPFEDEGSEAEGEEDGADRDGDRPRAGCGSLRRIELSSGRVTTLAGSGEQAGEKDGAGNRARFAAPGGLAATANWLYVSDRDGRTVRRLDLATLRVTTIAGRPSEAGGACDGRGAAARLAAPEGLALDGMGGLWIADGAALRRLDLASGWLRTAVGPTGLGVPVGLAAGAGRLFAADAAENVLFMSAGAPALTPGSLWDRVAPMTRRLVRRLP